MIFSTTGCLGILSKLCHCLRYLVCCVKCLVWKKDDTIIAECSLVKTSLFLGQRLLVGSYSMSMHKFMLHASYMMHNYCVRIVISHLWRKSLDWSFIMYSMQVDHIIGFAPHLPVSAKHMHSHLPCIECWQPLTPLLAPSGPIPEYLLLNIPPSLCAWSVEVQPELHLAFICLFFLRLASLCILPLRIAFSDELVEFPPPPSSRSQLEERQPRGANGSERSAVLHLALVLSGSMPKVGKNKKMWYSLQGKSISKKKSINAPQRPPVQFQCWTRTPDTWQRPRLHWLSCSSRKRVGSNQRSKPHLHFLWSVEGPDHLPGPVDHLDLLQDPWEGRGQTSRRYLRLPGVDGPFWSGGQGGQGGS